MLTYPNIDPVIFDIYGPLKLRWYSLGYMIGIFFGAYFASQQLKKQGKKDLNNGLYNCFLQRRQINSL